MTRSASSPTRPHSLPRAARFNGGPSACNGSRRRLTAFAPILLLAGGSSLLLGCTGVLGGEQADGSTGDCVDCPDIFGGDKDPGAVDEEGNPIGVLGVGWGTRYPRLSHAQYDNTVRDLFRWGEAPAYSQTFALDPDNANFDTFVTRTVSGNLWTDYQRTAEEIAGALAQNESLLMGIVPSDGVGDAEAFVNAFGLRAFRRPLTPDETSTFVALFDAAPSLFDGGDSFALGVQLVVRAMLQSPHFIYRVESSTTADGERVWLDGYELASRLSYALWNTMPSDELLDAAGAGALDTEAGVLEWTNRMLEDPRADQVLISFHEQFFHTKSYGTITKNETLFPTFTLALAPVLQEEARLFFHEVTVQNDGGIADVFTTPVTHVNAVTAPFYGISGDFGESLVRVDLDPNQRAGLLTQVGFLSRYGSQTQSDPILRGVHISLDYLCSDLPAPPNDIPPLPPLADGQTNRERVEVSTSVNPCAGCHEGYINPLGFAFEHYDAIGQYRQTDNGQPVDAADAYVIDGEEVLYQNAVELSTILAQSTDLHSCYAKKWLEYVLGRPPSEQEDFVVETLADASKGTPSLRGLLATITTMDTFRARPPEAN